MGYMWCEICVGYVWREICVGYVWCEIRQQSSEEPCDETSFGKKNLFVNDKDKVPSTGEFTGFLNHSQYNQSWNHLRKPLLHLNGNGISPGDADTIPLESGFDQLQYGSLDKQKKTGLKGQGLVVVLKGEMHIMYILSY